MANHGKLEGLIIVPTGGWAMSATDAGGGPVTVTVPAGEYYLTSIGNGSRSLLDEVAFQLTSHATLSLTYTASVSDAELTGTGKVTLSAGGTFSITWTATDLRDLLGFTANVSGSSSYTGANHARSLWMPQGAAKQTLYGDGDAGWFESDRQVVESPTGALYGWVGSKRRINRVKWSGVPRAKTRIAAESAVNESFERWWLDQVQAEAAWALPDCKVRLYWDAGNDASYATYNVSSGLETTEHSPMTENWVGRWDIEIPRLITTS